MNQEYETQSQDESENTVRPSFGAELRRAREQRGQSVEEVANALFVRPQLIAALESEDLSIFSAPVYAMGLLRSYARLLEIRPDPLLAALEGLERGHEPVLSSVNKISRSASSASGRQFMAGLVVGAVVLVIAVGVGFYQSRDGDNKAASPVTSSEVVGAGTEAGSPADDVKASAAMNDSTVAEPIGGDATTEPGATAVKPDAGEEPDSSTAVAEPEANLLLIFETDSWAEVHDAGGRRLLTRVGRAGQKLSLLGRAPFDVRLGYAPGVRIEYNGMPYVWEQKKGARVAHIQVGAASKP